MFNFKFDLSGIDALTRKLVNNAAAMTDIRDAWSLIYRAYIRRRYNSASKGSGEWAPLAPSTQRRRRRGRGRGQNAILRDTGAMYAATQPSLGASGLVQSLSMPLGIEISLGGSPLSTLAQYAQDGDAARNRPPREILVEPPEDEKDKMRKIAVTILAKHANED